MKMCQPHWDSLKAAISKLGLDHLVAKTGEAAAAQMVQELEGTADKFDPLMAAHSMILSNVLDHVGLGLFIPNEDGTDKCPLCYSNKLHQEHCTIEGCAFSYDNWTERAAQDCYEIAKQKGLLAEG